MIGLFRRRMLPKSNVNQIYLWVNAPTDSSIHATKDMALAIDEWLYAYEKPANEKPSIITNISYRIGVAPTPDFSNSFR